MNQVIRILRSLSRHVRHRGAIRQLMALDDHTLKDIGLTRATISYHVSHGRGGMPRNSSR